ncbi:MAG: hypothetical protein ABSE36_11725 [Terracidiphilus sp.]|jgi:hypothetical protein
MGLNFGKLTKLVKGGLDSDEIAEMLGSMGLVANISGLQPDQVDPAFQNAWEAAQEPGATILRIELRKQDGGKISGLLVLGNGSPLPCIQRTPAAAEKLLPQPA